MSPVLEQGRHLLMLCEKRFTKNIHDFQQVVGGTCFHPPSRTCHHAVPDMGFT
ncbi:hypothetical protein GXY_00943 [Novacetimonas hansenii ATCC 23769]|uniref:Uncharacterized protein n=1 Tax=Novacetimonas hansenii ATCC 23769 TaxID=714995 RepID=D5QAR8_NOVHA|nr:hypothetical protein GXY_00943 [Novacetimonas hansenii ATCC 23769]